MPQADTFDLAKLLDDGPIRKFTFWVMFWSLLSMLVDGYDLTTISYAAPSLVKDWHIERAALGPVFSIGITGMIIGGGIFGVLADRIGRRYALISVTLLISIATLGTTTARDITELVVWRFLTGLGVGGIVPVAFVISMEYAPKSRRAFFATCMFIGHASGSSLAGLVSALMLQDWGWKILFYIGGIGSLAITLGLALTLPESLRFLVCRRPNSPQIAQIALRLQPDLAIGPQTRFVLSGEREEAKVPYSLLFTEGRYRVTFLLWATFFIAQMILFGMVSWLPTILQASGVSIKGASLTTTMFTLCGLAAGLFITRAADRRGVWTLAALPLLGLPLFTYIGITSFDNPLLLVAVALSGTAITGLVMGFSGISGTFYPTAIRSNGVGAALFVSRLGAFVGPMIGAVLMSRGVALQTIFLGCLALLVLEAVGCILLGRADRVRLARNDAFPALSNISEPSPV
jgi:AAHS family 4-hydroxybenzoate transporter-like MFS transporter